MERLEQMRVELATMEKLGLTGFGVDYLREQIAKLETEAEKARVSALYDDLSEKATNLLQAIASIMREAGITRATADMVIDSDGKLTASFKSGQRTLKTETSGEEDTNKRGTPITVENVVYPSVSAALKTHGYEYKRDPLTNRVTNGKNYEDGAKWLEAKKLSVVRHK